MVQPGLDERRTWRRRGKRTEERGTGRRQDWASAPGAFESDAFEFQEMFAWELYRQNPGVKSKLLSCQVLR